MSSIAPIDADAPNVVWAIDFQFDSTIDGKAIRFASTILRMDNGPKLVSQALQRFCENKTGMVDIPAGCPWDNGYIESFNNRLRKECLNRNHWTTLFGAGWSSATSSTSTTTDTATQRWATPRRPSTLRHAGIPHTGGLPDQPNPDKPPRL